MASNIQRWFLRTPGSVVQICSRPENILSNSRDFHRLMVGQPSGFPAITMNLRLRCIRQAP